jgi:Subtilase family/IPT/TIG domain
MKLIPFSSVFAFSLLLLSPAAKAQLQQLAPVQAARADQIARPQEVQNADDHYFLPGNKRVDLQRVNDEVVVKFKVTPQNKGKAIANFQADRAKKGGRQFTKKYTIKGNKDDNDEEGLQILSASNARASLGELKVDPTVEKVMTVYLNPATGKRLIEQPEVLILLKEGTTIGQVQAALNPLGLTTIRAVGGNDIRSYRLAFTPNVAVPDALAAVRSAAAVPGIEAAEPNFIQEVEFSDVNTWTTNDPLYAGQQPHLDNDGQYGATANADISAPTAWRTLMGKAGNVSGAGRSWAANAQANAQVFPGDLIFHDFGTPVARQLYQVDSITTGNTSGTLGSSGPTHTTTITPVPANGEVRLRWLRTVGRPWVSSPPMSLNQGDNLLAGGNIYEVLTGGTADTAEPSRITASRIAGNGTANLVYLGERGMQWTAGIVANAGDLISNNGNVYRLNRVSARTGTAAPTADGINGQVELDTVGSFTGDPQWQAAPLPQALWGINAGNFVRHLENLYYCTTSGSYDRAIPPTHTGNVTQATGTGTAQLLWFAGEWSANTIVSTNQLIFNLVGTNLTIFSATVPDNTASGFTPTTPPVATTAAQIQLNSGTATLQWTATIVTQWSSNENRAVGSRVWHNNLGTVNLYEVTTAGSLGTTAPTHVSGAVTATGGTGTMAVLIRRGRIWHFGADATVNTEYFWGNDLFRVTNAGVLAAVPNLDARWIGLSGNDWSLRSANLIAGEVVFNNTSRYLVVSSGSRGTIAPTGTGGQITTGQVALRYVSSQSPVVAVIDSGIDVGAGNTNANLAHEDLTFFSNRSEQGGTPNVDDDGNGRIDDFIGWNFWENNNQVHDIEGHGTAVAGIIGANQSGAQTGIGLSGVAPGVRILPVRAADASRNFMNWGDVAAAIEYAAQFADVINCSFAGGSESAIMNHHVTRASTAQPERRARLVMCATGNGADWWENFSGTFNGNADSQYFLLFRFNNNAGDSGDNRVRIDNVRVQVGGADVLALEQFDAAAVPIGWDIDGTVDGPGVADEWARLDTDGVNRGSATIACLQSSLADGIHTISQARSPVFSANGSATITLRFTRNFHSADSFQVLILRRPTGTNDIPTTLGSYTAITGRANVAGFQNRENISFPASSPNAIGVGASTDLDRRSPFSQFVDGPNASNNGGRLEFVAPGGGGVRDISTTDIRGNAGYNLNTTPAADNFGDRSYSRTFVGTSAATPVASGVAAMLFAAYPGLTREDVLDIMRGTCAQIGNGTYENERAGEYGYGRLNAAAALARAGARPAFTEPASDTLYTSSDSISIIGTNLWGNPSMDSVGRTLRVEARPVVGGSSFVLATAKAPTTDPTPRAEANHALTATTPATISTGNYNLVVVTPAGESVATPIQIRSNPTLANASANSVTRTTASVSLDINPQGAATRSPAETTAGQMRLEYGTGITYGSHETATLLVNDDTSWQTISFSLTGLTGSTTYFYRLKATNGRGTDSEITGQFRTIDLPTLAFDAVTGITPFTATINGSVTPNGSATETPGAGAGTIVVEYGTDSNFVNTLSTEYITFSYPLDDFEPHTFTVSLSGLSFQTQYYYRVTAQNSAGVSTQTGYFITNVVTFASATEVGITLSSPFISDGSTLMLNFTGGYSPANGETLMIIDNTGVAPIDGTYYNMQEGGVFAVDIGGVQSFFTVSYAGGDGNDLVLTTVTGGYLAGSLSKQFGLSGDTVRVFGNGLYNATVDFNGTTVASGGGDTEIGFIVPSGLTVGVYTVTVKFNGVAAASFAFLVRPMVNAFAPNTWVFAGNSTLTITGASLSGVTSVKIDGQSAVPVINGTGTSLNVTIPSLVGFGGNFQVSMIQSGIEFTWSGNVVILVKQLNHPNHIGASVWNPNVTGVSLFLSLGYTPSVGNNLVIIDNSGGAAISGVFSNLPNGGGFVVDVGGVKSYFLANYAAGSGNDLFLKTVAGTDLAGSLSAPFGFSGDTVTVNGNGLNNATVDFNGSNVAWSGAANATNTQRSFIVPSGLAVGNYNVTVKFNGVGTPPLSYLVRPVVNAFATNTWVSAGGKLSITGTSLSGVTAVKIGGKTLTPLINGAGTSLEVTLSADVAAAANTTVSMVQGGVEFTWLGSNIEVLAYPSVSTNTPCSVHGRKIIIAPTLSGSEIRQIENLTFANVAVPFTLTNTTPKQIELTIPNSLGYGLSLVKCKINRVDITVDVPSSFQSNMFLVGLDELWLPPQNRDSNGLGPRWLDTRQPGLSIGESRYGPTNGMFAVKGEGVGPIPGGTSDNFHFLKTFGGDPGDIVCRLVSTGESASGSAGLIWKVNTDSFYTESNGSFFAIRAIPVTGQLYTHQISVLYRDFSDSSAISLPPSINASLANTSLPIVLRIVRPSQTVTTTGSVTTTFYAEWWSESNPTVKAKTATLTLARGGSGDRGIYSCSGAAGVSNTALFDQVTVRGEYRLLSPYPYALPTASAPYLAPSFPGGRFPPLITNNYIWWADLVDNVQGLACDLDQTLYFTKGDNKIYSKAYGSSTITHVAGTGVAGFSGDGGDPKQATFSNPRHIALDGYGRVYVYDSGNRRVRMITLADPLLGATSSSIETVAGGTAAVFEAAGMSKVGSSAIGIALPSMDALAVSPNGTMYIAANSCIRMISPKPPANVTPAQQNFTIPVGMPTPAGYLTLLSALRTPGTIVGVIGRFGTSGYAGDAGSAWASTTATAGVRTTAKGLALDNSGNLYIAESTHRIRRVLGVHGLIQRIAGSSNGTSGNSAEWTFANTALLNSPIRLSADYFGNLHFWDSGNGWLKALSTYYSSSGSSTFTP